MSQLSQNVPVQPIGRAIKNQICTGFAILPSAGRNRPAPEIETQPGDPQQPWHRPI